MSSSGYCPGTGYMHEIDATIPLTSIYCGYKFFLGNPQLFRESLSKKAPKVRIEQALLQSRCGVASKQPAGAGGTLRSSKVCAVDNGYGGSA